MVIVLELQGDGFFFLLYDFSEVWLYALLNGRDLPFSRIYIYLSKNWKTSTNSDGYHTILWNSLYSSYCLSID